MVGREVGFSCRLPRWVHDAGNSNRSCPTARDKMTVVNTPARRNVGEDTGGPFEAAVFDLTTDRLVAPGINMVVPSSNPTVHAEIVAVSVTGSTLGSYDLGDEDRKPPALVTSVEPRATCLGGTG